MEINDIETTIEKLNSIVTIFGWSGAIFMMVAIAVSIFAWKYLVKSSERIAEEASEKSLKKFQSLLDKELAKFQANHQKQIDAIQDTFQRFQRMKSMINFIMKGENFTQQMKPKKQLSYLIEFRHEFKKIYSQNRLLFLNQLCLKIDELILTIDQFIETFEGGLFEEPSEEIKELHKEHGTTWLTGVWSAGAFDEILSQLEEVSKEIETEFRKIYGTYE